MKWTKDQLTSKVNPQDVDHAVIAAEVGTYSHHLSYTSTDSCFAQALIFDSFAFKLFLVCMLIALRNQCHVLAETVRRMCTIFCNKFRF